MNTEFKTAEQKATEAVEKFCDKTGLLSMDGKGAKELTEIVRMALKEQDRDTRHACAEAVMQCEEVNKEAADMVNKVVSADQAHGVCINARAV